MNSAEFPSLESLEEAGEPNPRNRRLLDLKTCRSAIDSPHGNPRHHRRGIADQTLAVGSATPLNLNDRVTITVSSAALDGRIVWLNGQDCGVAFDQGFALASGCCALGRHDGRPHDEAVVAANKSMSERKAENDRNFQPGLKVRVVLDDGREANGIVRWSRDNIAGLILLETVVTPSFSAPMRDPSLL
jgi:hypothetical protein